MNAGNETVLGNLLARVIAFGISPEHLKNKVYFERHKKGDCSLQRTLRKRTAFRKPNVISMACAVKNDASRSACNGSNAHSPQHVVLCKTHSKTLSQECR